MQQESSSASAAGSIGRLPGHTAVTLPLAALAAQFLIGLLLRLSGLGQAFPREQSPVIVLVVVAGASGLIYLAMVGFILKRRRLHWRDLGLVPTPVSAVAAAVAIGLATAVLASAFDAALRGSAVSPFRSLTAGELASVFLVLGVWVPFAEEAVFRGVVFSVLRARLGAAAAIVVSALIFGAFHLIPAQMVVGMVLGIPLAWLRHRWGSLFASFTLHVTHNVCVVALGAWVLS
jgi:membrane protease YdiL (CAAX protease family)